MKKNLFGILSIGLLSFTRLLQLYNANLAHVDLGHAMVVAAIGSAVLLGEYALFRWLLKNHFSAVLFCLETFLLMTSIPALFEAAIGISAFLGSPYTVAGLAVLAVPCALLALLLSRLGKKLPRECNGFLAILTGVMLVMNLAPVVALQLGRVPALAYKQDYVVSEGTEQPNIYWFHLDGMNSTETAQQYFGVDSSAFLQKLTEQGFTLFPNAILAANHKTEVATAALMCPDFYDQKLRALLQDPTDQDTARRYSEANYAENWVARYHNEVLTAFARRGYATHLLSHYTNTSFLSQANRLYSIPQHTYRDLSENEQPKAYLVENSRFVDEGRREQLEELMTLLLGPRGKDVGDLLPNSAGERLVPIPQHPPQELIDRVLLGNPIATYYYTGLVESLYDSLEAGDSPRFTLVHYLPSHFPFTFTPDGSVIRKGYGFDFPNFATHYEIQSQILANLVEMILDKDPSAVIVLVADHGIHVYTPELIAAFGEATLPEFWNHIFYALRLPSQWDGQPDMALLSDPRNIGRYLVNTFVGENYAYIEP
jgi:hypothetical protein